VAHPETDGQKSDVEAVLAGLGLGVEITDAMFEVLNKTDLLEEPAREALLAQSARDPRQMPISALTGAGIDQLLGAVDQRLAAQRTVETYRLGHEEGAAQAWLYNHGEVLNRVDDEGYSDITVRLAPEDVQRFERQRNGKMPGEKTNGDRSNEGGR
jgi:GTP-binding protein HflX